MIKRTHHKGRNFELLIMGFVFLVLFAIPVIFTRVDDQISWLHVRKIWIDQSLLLPLFLINHFLLVPKLLLRKKYISYFVIILSLILSFSLGYKGFESNTYKSKSNTVQNPTNKPKPIPPYAHLLMYSLLIVGVDTGLLFTRKWNENEHARNLLEKRNTEMQLDILRNQVSPHFLMNTLNNIYALIDLDSPKAKEAVMKLSKLMRYMLYENKNGKVKLSKEFEFVKSYIDLMKLRYADAKDIQLTLPEVYDDVLIPPLLFISYIENAFKHGTSYENESQIDISFQLIDNELIFNCKNIKHYQNEKGGIGLENSKNRLNLLFGNDYELNINSPENEFEVNLKIPTV